MSTKHYSGFLFHRGEFSGVDDVLPVEEVLSISINDQPFTITMRSPGKEKELIRGLLFTEGVVGEVVPDLEPVVRGRSMAGLITALDVTVPDDYLLKAFAGQRSIASSSSCGLCGRTTFEEEIISASKMFQLAPEMVNSLFEQVALHQIDFKASGGTHASGVFSRDGRLLSVMEDIGRHNAVDKVIGDLLIKGKLQEADCITVSGRISYEIISKVMKAGIPMIASVSAPSSMAVETAAAAGITLIAFCRNDKFTVYTHRERIVEPAVVEMKK